MIGLGTLINVAAIIIGGVIGLLGGKWLTVRCQETLTRSMGICVLFVGIASVMEQMLTVQGEKLPALIVAVMYALAGF